MFMEFVEKSKKVRGLAGVDVFADKGKTQLRNIRDLIPEIIAGAKGNEVKLSEIFGMRGKRAVDSLVAEFNKASYYLALAINGNGHDHADA